MEDVPAVKAGRKARGWCFVQVVVAFTSVTLCVLLYAPQVSLLSTSYGATAADFLSVTTRVDDGGRAEDVEDMSDGDALLVGDLDNQVGSPCSLLPDHAICCDRSDANADVCFMSGDVRTDSSTLSLLLFPPSRGAATAAEQQVERIHPYTRKWDPTVTKTIHEVTLRVAKPDESASHRCDVRHAAPAHVVTAGGYNAGNLFHAFNDGFLPAWITTQHLRRRQGVVLAVLAYDPAWARRYAEVVAGLSGGRGGVVDLVNDNRTHCFPGAIVGTRFHGYLAVDPARLKDNKTVLDFHNLLSHAYNKAPSQSRIRRMSDQSKTAYEQQQQQQQQQRRRPRLGIVSRRGTRVIENEAAVARLAAHVGFDVDILDAAKTNPPPMAALRAEVDGLDVLVGAHGSDLTSLLFLRPGRAALVQVTPLGVGELAHGLFGVPARRMGLRYVQYDVRGHESSLSRVYEPGDVVVADPERAMRRNGSGAGVGDDLDWEFIGRVYLGGQNVTLDLARFRKTLAGLHTWVLEQQREGAGSE